MSIDLQNYILSQLAQGESIEDITNTLLNHGHTLEQIAKASQPQKQMSFENRSQRSFLSLLGRLLLWMILIGLGIGLGIYLTLTELITPYLPQEILSLRSEQNQVQSQLTQNADEKKISESTESAQITDSTQCNEYIVLGYFDGLADTEDSLSLTPEACLTSYDKGFNQAVREANQTNVEFSDVDREEDLQVLLDLIAEYKQDNYFEELVLSITKTPQEIGLGADKLDLSKFLINLYENQPGDERIFPYDPERGSFGSSQYFIYYDEKDRLVIETVSEDDESVKIARVQ